MVQISGRAGTQSFGIQQSTVAPFRSQRCGFKGLLSGHSVFRRAALIASVPTILSVVFRLFPESIPSGVCPENTSIYTALFSVIGFVLVFRTSQAYSRFWEGATLLNTVTSTWFDACAQIVVFIDSSDLAPAEKAQAYKDSAVRLFSLLHCCALQQVSTKEDDDFEVIDVPGFDENLMDCLKMLTDRKQHTETVFKWVNRLILDAINDGVIGRAASAPIVSRCFHELNSGLTALNTMTAITDTPFPARYTEVINALLCMHAMITPFIVGGLDIPVVWAGIFSFVSVGSLWAINFIAATIEQPFGDDENNFDLTQLQIELNNSLFVLLDKDLEAMPIQPMSAGFVGKVESVVSYNGSSRPMGGGLWTARSGTMEHIGTESAQMVNKPPSRIKSKCKGKPQSSKSWKMQLRRKFSAGHAQKTHAKVNTPAPAAPVPLAVGKMMSKTPSNMKAVKHDASAYDYDQVVVERLKSNAHSGTSTGAHAKTQSARQVGDKSARHTHLKVEPFAEIQLPVSKNSSHEEIYTVSKTSSHEKIVITPSP